MNTRHVKKIVLASDVESKISGTSNDSTDSKLTKHMSDYPISTGYDPATYKPHIQDSERTAYNAVVDEAVRTTNVNQTVGGVKTFSSSPIVPTPTTATQAANKDYVDSVAGGGTWTTLPTASYTSTGLALLFSASSGIYTANYEIDIDIKFRYGSGNETFAKFVIPKGTAAPSIFSSVGTFTLTSVTYAVMNVPLSSIFGSGDIAVIVYRKNGTTGYIRPTIHNTSYTSTVTATDTTIGEDLLAFTPSTSPYAGTTNKTLYICIKYR